MIRKAFHELSRTISSLGVVKKELHVAHFVLEGETLSHWEGGPTWHQFHGLEVVRLVCERVSDTHGERVVVFNVKLLH